MRTVLPMGRLSKQLATNVWPIHAHLGGSTDIAVGKETAAANLPVAYGQIAGIDSYISLGDQVRIAIDDPCP